MAAMNFGWVTFRGNAGYFLRLILLFLVIQIAIDVLYCRTAGAVMSFLIAMVSAVMGSVLQLGLIGISLEFYDGRKPSLSDLFFFYPHFIPYLLASLAYAVVVAAGLALLLVPGLYLMLRMQFYSYLVVDMDLGWAASLRKSWSITDGQIRRLSVFLAVLLLVNLCGALALGIGLLMTLPVTALAYAYVYRQLARPVTSQLYTT